MYHVQFKLFVVLVNFISTAAHLNSAVSANKQLVHIAPLHKYLEKLDPLMATGQTDGQCQSTEDHNRCKELRSLTDKINRSKWNSARQKAKNLLDGRDITVCKCDSDQVKQSQTTLKAMMTKTKNRNNQNFNKKNAMEAFHQTFQCETSTSAYSGNFFCKGKIM